jgi:hypothetical protein
MKLFLSTPALKSEALHYTLISYLLRQGVSPSIISKITRNSCPEYPHASLVTLI